MFRNHFALVLCLGTLSGPTAGTAQGHDHAAGPAGTTGSAAYLEAISSDRELYTGAGAHRFRVDLEWLRRVENGFRGPTHGGVVVDSKGRVYVSTDSTDGLFVLSQRGETLAKLGPDTQYLHAMVLVEEAGREVIVAASPANKQLLRFSLDGEVLLTIPNETTGEVPKGLGGVNGVCVLPDGRIVATCGYGSNKVHVFDSRGKLLHTFGGRGEGEGEFMNCHGIACDTRFGSPRLLIANRGSHRLDHYSPEGEFLGVHATGLSLPCVPVVRGELCYVAELNGRVTVIDKSGATLARLGENSDEQERGKFDLPKSAWKPGVFSAPHGLAFDSAGSLYVQDWNETGRVTRLIPSPE